MAETKEHFTELETKDKEMQERGLGPYWSEQGKLADMKDSAKAKTGLGKKSEVPENEKFEKIKKLRSQNLPTIPSSLDDEIKSNIFLRTDQKDLKIKLNMKKKHS